jgi:hypothetical protein
MTKFYIQSGNFRTTINAADAEKAALWAVHKVMEQILPFQDNVDTDPHQKCSNCLRDGLMVLGETMDVSEVGFESDVQIEFDTLDLQIHWHQLTIALSRLESMFSSGPNNLHDLACLELAGCDG